MNTVRPALTAAAALVLAAAVAACSGAATNGTTPSLSPAAAASPSAAASGAPTTAATKVSANTATYDELVAALSAAGVTSAARWATEVMEYRPYDTSDPMLAHLQDELAKYNPDDQTLNAILSVLTP
jgi:ABC-type glycerol-3-phosphate transport system substrate-binding protein